MRDIVLIGADDVRRAGSQISSAAESMSRSVGTVDDALHRQRLFLDDWLYRFECILENDRAHRNQGNDS